MSVIMHKQIFQALSMNLVPTVINDVILGNNLRAWNLIQPGRISIKWSLLPPETCGLAKIEVLVNLLPKKTFKRYVGWKHGQLPIVKVTNHEGWGRALDLWSLDLDFQSPICVERIVIMATGYNKSQGQSSSESILCRFPPRLYCKI